MAGDIMERILLVEPNYKNKYPPIGLMKVSTYFKSKNDFVMFHKGLMPQNEVITFDKVFITTLFTFDFDMCVDTIRYYAAIVGIENVFVGGIAATIMPDRFRDSIPAVRILEGQLITSNILGYTDNVNIDILALDYDILWDISYQYPTEDSYFIYTSRGCPRKCDFCAVKTLEPDFKECQNIIEQISSVDLQFGHKKNLLIMDNNILYSKNLNTTVEALEKLGFGRSNNIIQKNSNMPYFLRSLWDRILIGKQYTHLLNRIKKEFTSLSFTRINSADASVLSQAIALIGSKKDEEFIQYLRDNQEFIEDFYSRYHYHKIKRYVDFNQGLDARLFTEEKARLLSHLAIKPCRIAFDDLKTKDYYFKALDMAVDQGIKSFSNYLLYNFKETPEDLWTRLHLNVEYCEKKPDISLFSFPMRYASIEHTDRNYIGRYWNKKYLRSIGVILNVTSGVVAKEKDFFYRAFGQNSSEFLEILAMPDDFIRYRDYFEHYNLIQHWRQMYRNLSADEKIELVSILSSVATEVDAPSVTHSANLNSILQLYSINKNRMEHNKQYYLRMLDLQQTDAGAIGPTSRY